MTSTELVTIEALVEGAKADLAIAESGNSKKAAYEAAAEKLAAIKAAGHSAKAIGELVGCSSAKVSALLKWRASGFEAETPFLMDKKATTRAQMSHTRAALRDPEKRRTAMDSLTEDERVEVARDAMRDKNVRERVDADERQEHIERTRKAKRAVAARGEPTPLSQFYWRIVGRLREWTRDLRIIRDEQGTLMTEQREHVVEQLTELRDMAQECIDAIERKPTDALDVIEGTVSEPKELTA